jgi:hypothetical protein
VICCFAYGKIFDFTGWSKIYNSIIACNSPFLMQGFFCCWFALTAFHINFHCDRDSVIVGLVKRFPNLYRRATWPTLRARSTRAIWPEGRLRRPRRRQSSPLRLRYIQAVLRIHGKISVRIRMRIHDLTELWRAK